jgi:hypothetical protein
LAASATVLVLPEQLQVAGEPAGQLDRGVEFGKGSPLRA